MARPLRIWVAGGWYHVTARGNRQEEIFRTDLDRRRFLGLVEGLVERFGVEVHAFVLMDNHYHLVVRTPEPNLSEAMRWLQVTYTSRFNWAHRQKGHLFQGRFKAILIEELAGVVKVARYVHLNPVRVGRLGLGKAAQRQARVVGGVDPGVKLVQQRLMMLRDYPWSSWRVYQGAESKPAWLETRVVEASCGGHSRAERRRALREYTEAPIREGRLESPWSDLVGGVVLGGKEFAQRLMKKQQAEGRKKDRDEQLAVRQMERAERLDWEEIVKCAEELRGMRWAEMVDRWGDWGRDATIYVAVRHGGHRLSDIVRAVGGMKYGAAAQAVRRFAVELKTDHAKARFAHKLRARVG